MENQELQALKHQMQRMQEVLTSQQKQSLLSANTSTIVQKEYQSPPAKKTTDEQEEKESDESSETSELESSIKRTFTDASECSTDSSTSKSIQAKKIKIFLHERLSPKE